MEHSIFTLMVLGVFSCMVAAQESALIAEGDDMHFQESSSPLNDNVVVRAILDSNNLSDVEVSAISTREDGRIVRLDLSNRRITEPFLKKLPPVIGELTALRVLSLAHNDLGVIPAEIGNCSALRELDIKGNELKALPSTIGNLVNLQKFDARHNELTDLPASFDKLENLWYLHLWSNEFTTLPVVITRLPALKELYLKSNDLKSLPVQITRLNLDYIDVIENRICKPDPAVDAWLQDFDEEWAKTQRCW